MAYRIKSVAELTGISPATLRAWERRYGTVAPQRTESGYREYSKEEVTRLIQIKVLVDRGFKVGEAIAMVEEEMPLMNADQPSATIAGIRDDLLDALLALDRTRAGQVGERLDVLSLDQQIEEVLMPVLREVGARWARAEATIVQEHFASAFAREKLAGMLHSLGSGCATGPEVICAGAPGETHELGLLAIAVHLAARGWQVTYIGPDVPATELRPLLKERRPAMLCTSLIYPVEEGACLEYARTLRQMAPPETRVVVGGAGIPPGVVGTPGEKLHLIRHLDELLALAA